ncbi:FAD-dependent oxidoreductase [Microbacterium sp. MC2]
MTPASLWQLTGPAIAADGTLPPRADVVVAGGGLAGLAVATELVRHGRFVVVVEAQEFGGRTTGGTTGKVSLLQGATVSRVLSHAGRATARAYLDAAEAAQRWLREELAEVPDAWQAQHASTFATTEAGVRVLQREAKAMAAAKRPVRHHVDAVPGLPLPVRAALTLDDQAQLHPARATAALAAAVRAGGGILVDRCRVQKVHAGGTGLEIETTRGTVRAEHLVLATGTPVLDRTLAFARLVATREVVAAYRLPDSGGPAPLTGIHLSVDPTSHSLRMATAPDGAPALVVGGAGYDTGRGTADVTGLHAWVAAHFPGAEPFTWWAAQDYRPTTGAPLAGPAGFGGGRVHVATGFAKWGMTGAVAAALAIAGRMADAEPAWAAPLYRRRPRLQGAAATVKAGAEVGAHLIGGWVGLGRPAPGDGARIGRDGVQPVAESTVDGRVCRVSAVCTHMGGIVRWNETERTWDCPLHGSRFAATGEVIEGPAVSDLPRIDDGADTRRRTDEHAQPG